MAYDNIDDVFDETSIEHVKVPLKVYRNSGETEPIKSYQELRNVLSLKNLEFFTLTVLIGKYIAKSRKKFEDTGEQFFKYSNKIDAKDEMTILKAVAVDEVNNIYILRDYVEMRKIWQEYSYAGFEELYSWHIDKNINLQTKLSEEILNAYDEINFDEEID